MIKAFLSQRKLAIPALVLILYLCLSLVVFPVIWEGNTSLRFSLMRILLTRDYSIYPFLYSLVVAFIIYLPWMYRARKVIGIKTSISVAYWYLFLFLTGWTVYLFLSFETGWGVLVFYLALMFYPSKYAFISNVMLLCFIVFYSKDAVLEKRASGGKFRGFLFFLYLCFAAGVPYVLSLNRVTFLTHSLTKPLVFSCSLDDGIRTVKQCVDDTIKKRENSFEKRFARMLNPRLMAYRTNFCKNFIEADAVLEKEFHSVKDCYAIDKCVKDLPKGEPNSLRVIKYDEFGDIYIWVDSSSAYAEKDGKGLYLSLTDNGRLYSLGDIKQYPQSLFIRKKDVVIVKRQDEEEIFVVGGEYIPLEKDASFIVISVARFGKMERTEYDEYRLNYQGGYKFYTSCLGYKCFNQDLEISADKREEPTALYVRFGDDVFEVENVF